MLQIWRKYVATYVESNLIAVTIREVSGPQRRARHDQAVATHHRQTPEPLANREGTSIFSVVERRVMKGRAKPEKLAQVLACVKAGECLVCGKSGYLRRGQCPSCYCRFRRQLVGRMKADRVEMERQAIREGLILGVQQVRAIRRDDPFAIL
jgi:hypothetical protein